MYTGGAAEIVLSTLRFSKTMVYGWYYHTVYIFHHHLPNLNLYTTKWYWSVEEAFSIVFFISSYASLS